MDIQVTNSTGGKKNLKIDKYPNTCPFCHKSIDALKYEGFENDNNVEIVYRCPNEECKKIFIGYYEEILDNNTNKWIFSLTKTMTGVIKERDFSEDIQSISTTFIEIYNQSITAENSGLNHICGIGLRKALEFLIKDYLIKKHPDKKAEIVNKLLGNCINDYIENPNVKSMSKRATWLGNDQTHYTKKWEDKDIKDLKLLIDISLHWMEMEVLTEKYNSEMK
jgi:hypothetical protein